MNVKLIDMITIKKRMSYVHIQGNTFQETNKKNRVSSMVIKEVFIIKIKKIILKYSPKKK